MIRRILLGSTNLEVSRLCFGTGTSGFGCESIQSRVAPEAFGKLLRSAHERGITFWDGSDDYGTYQHLREGLKGLDRASVQLTSKTWAADAAGARHSVEEGLRELGCEYFDLFLMHEVDTVEDLEARRPALAELHRLKDQGLIRAVGMSTHAILIAEYAAGLEGIEVLMTNYNKAELHMDAGLNDYSAALASAHRAGQGVLVMKTLAEGKLGHDVEDAVRHNLEKSFIHGVLVGMKNEQELDELLELAFRYDRMGSEVSVAG